MVSQFRVNMDSEEVMFDKKTYMKIYNKQHAQEQRLWRFTHQEQQRQNIQKSNLRHPDRNSGRTNYIPGRQVCYKKAQKLPLTCFCELCPDDDKRVAVVRHHPDYDHPELFVSCCQSCHMFVERRMKS